MESDEKRGAKYTRANYGGAAAVFLVKDDKNVFSTIFSPGICVYNVCTTILFFLRFQCVRHKESACNVGISVCNVCTIILFLKWQCVRHKESTCYVGDFWWCDTTV